MLVTLSQVMGGLLLASVVFIVWVFAASSFDGFWQSVVVMSRSLGTQRVGRIHSGSELLQLRKTWPFVRVVIAALALCALSPRVLLRRHNAVIVSILLGCVLLQNLFAEVTLNEVENSLSYLGLLNALAFVLVTEVFWVATPQEGANRLKRTIPILAALALFGRSSMNAWRVDETRVVQQFNANTAFSERVHVKGASRVLWGEATFVNDSRVTRTDFDEVNAWLEKSQSNFFVFSNSSMLYGLHGRPSPQPWVLLTPGHSFRSADSPHVGSVIVDNLKKHDVTVIVLEGSLFENDPILVKMSPLHGWITREFHKETQFGGYQIWTVNR